MKLSEKELQELYSTIDYDDAIVPQKVVLPSEVIILELLYPKKKKRTFKNNIFLKKI